MFRLTRILLPCIFYSLFFAVSFAQNPPERRASISGRVMVDGKPSANGMVTVVEVNPKINGDRIIQSNGRESVDRLGYTAATDEDGGYLFTGLPAGQYKVTALSPAYVPEDRAQGEESAKQITLDDGETREKIDFALIRGGVITGRVTDAENRPHISKLVRLTEVRDPGQKAEIFRQPSNMFNTDDRGVYRIYGLRTGRYILSAGGENNIFDGRKFERTYHPNTTIEVQAQVIEVKEGKEVAGIDIRLVNSGKTYEVMGRVTEAETGKAIPQIRVHCMEVAKPEDDYGNGVSDALTDIQGNFHLSGVRPGKYKVQLSAWNAGHPFYGEGKYFEINSENATGIELTVKRGGTVSGVVVLEGGKNRGIENNLHRSTVYMDVRRDVERGYVKEASSFSQVSPDGSFHFIGLPPGKLHLAISDNNNAFFVRRVERDGITQPDGINVAPGENINGVRIIVAHCDGAIRGEVKVIGGTLPENYTIYVWAGLMGAVGFFKTATVDEKGRFLIEGLLPGEYSFQFSHSIKPGFESSNQPKMPKPVTQHVSVTSGAETNAIITYDLSRVDQ
jgi:Carboxypeptidase regulatory-like domain